MKKINKFKIIVCFIILTILTITPAIINTSSSDSVILGGENIGMELKGKGLIVSNTTTIHCDNISYNPSIDSDIKIGDLIYEIDENKIFSLKDLEKYMSTFNDDLISVSLKIKRNNNSIVRKLNIYKIDNNYKTGLFIKEKILGIGTLTFIDPKTKKYAALGHEVRDSDYQEVYPINSGSIYESTVTGIKRSINGNPGEKIAQIDKKSVIGTIEKNTIFGIYGKYYGKTANNLIETSDHVIKGKAYIITTLDDNTIKEYAIEITNVKEQIKKETKGFSFKVVDKNLLNKTNGIIQGMSGSPVVQDGKLIGAVTHVIVDDCTCGHGVFIRFMLEEMNNN